MTPHLVVRSVAEEDIAAAALWYEARAAGLGADFLRAIDVTLAEIKRMPERFPVVHLMRRSTEIDWERLAHRLCTKRWAAGVMCGQAALLELGGCDGRFALRHSQRST